MYLEISFFSKKLSINHDFAAEKMSDTRGITKSSQDYCFATVHLYHIYSCGFEFTLDLLSF